MLKKETEVKVIDQATADNYRFLFVEKSGNKKTGIISQTYTATCNCKEGSCPGRCPFANAGCYAKNFMVNANWKKIPETGRNIDQLREAIERSHKKTEVIRHNIAGDIAVEGTDQINKALLEKLTDIYRKNFKVAFSYTHCEVNDRNLSLVKAAAEKTSLLILVLRISKQPKKLRKLAAMLL